MKSITTLFLGAGALVLTSCVSVPRDAGTNDVQQAITERGGPVVEWRAQPATADDERIAAMLEDELIADEAVAIALINNPRLQVTLAELGIALEAESSSRLRAAWATVAEARARVDGWYQQPRGTSAWRVDALSTSPVQTPAKPATPAAPQQKPAHEGHGK